MAMDPLVGEALTAVRALEIALSSRWDRVFFETDSKLLSEDVNSEDQPLCWKTVAEVLALRREFRMQPDWSFCWIPRKLNQ
ncbi:hypothetical protein CJ030_MR4G001421 [Morella rubra]|uniref:RNase H type-1 domain-containing protein n=1 Tax=Morella rubra TaxID=262757 RepID=A0A6A1VR44_9ROSI|nr:hypothetical protein CJ030_MR4G001421 [Morella rubra]